MQGAECADHANCARCLGCRIELCRHASDMKTLSTTKHCILCMRLVCRHISVTYEVMVCLNHDNRCKEHTPINTKPHDDTQLAATQLTKHIVVVVFSQSSPAPYPLMICLSQRLLWISPTIRNLIRVNCAAHTHSHR